MRGRGGKWHLPAPLFPENLPNRLGNLYKQISPAFALGIVQTVLHCLSVGCCHFKSGGPTMLGFPAGPVQSHWLLKLQPLSSTHYTNSQNSTSLIFKTRYCGFFPWVGFLVLSLLCTYSFLPPISIPCFSCLFLTLSICLSFAGLGRMKPKWDLHAWLERLGKMLTHPSLLS